eukprot:gene13213-14565_t
MDDGGFLNGANLEAFWDLLDENMLKEDNELFEQISDIETEVPNEEAASFECSQCEKKYKTRNGLTRHTNTKHPAPGQQNPGLEKPTIHPL